MSEVSWKKVSSTFKAESKSLNRVRVTFSPQRCGAEGCFNWRARSKVIGLVGGLIYFN